MNFLISPVVSMYEFSFFVLQKAGIDHKFLIISSKILLNTTVCRIDRGELVDVFCVFKAYLETY